MNVGLCAWNRLARLRIYCLAAQFIFGTLFCANNCHCAKRRKKSDSEFLSYFPHSNVKQNRRLKVDVDLAVLVVYSLD